MATSGFKSWTKGQSYWVTSAEYWGFTLASYSVIFAFFLLLLSSPLIIDGAFRPEPAEGALRGQSLIILKANNTESKFRQIRDGFLNGL